MTNIVVVSLLPDRHLCGELSFHLYLKMIREKKGIYNKCKNEKKYPRQIQDPVTDLKIESLAKNVNDLKL